MQCKDMRSLIACYRHRPRLQRCQIERFLSCRYSVQKSSAGSALPSTAPGPPEPLFSLEASVGAANPLDIQLISTGAFKAEVHPDLPIATTWQGLYKQFANKLQAKARKEARAAAAAAQATHNAAIQSQILLSEEAIASAGVKPVWHVATVGAQLNSLTDISDTMCAAAGVTRAGQHLAQAEHKPHADALLLVSGSHPFRQIPMLRQMLPSSVKMLRHATGLKQQGILPQELSLWAVANPVMEKDASYTERKIDAGAEVILTQPPLDWEAFESWMSDARNRGLHTAARLLIGFPCLSSAGNVAFWAALCQAGSNPKVGQLQQQFARAEQQQQQQQPSSSGSDSDSNGSSGSRIAKASAMTPFAEQWNRQLLSRLQATPGVRGLHVMAITANSKRLALQMAQEGAFAAAAWPLAVAAASHNTQDAGATGNPTA